MRNKPYIIGLTGGIASGKSAVGSVFERLGAKVIDADLIARKVVEKGSVGYEMLKKEFSSAFGENGLDRRALRAQVFFSEENRRKLNDITHPLIIAQTYRETESLSAGDIAVLVAPLLFETGLDKLADITVTVSADTATRLLRLTERDKVSADTAMAMINSQLTDEQRESRADVVIRNDGTIKQLREKAAALYNEIAERSV